MRISRKIPREMMPRDGGPGPTRRIESRNPLRVIRLFPSSFMGCMVPCESLGEYEQMTCVEADGSVLRFRAQADPVTWNDDGTMRRHTPDLEVLYDDGRTVLQEVKAFASLSKEKLSLYERRAEIIQDDLAPHGISYELVDSTSSGFRQRYLAADTVVAAGLGSVPHGLSHIVREAVLLHGASTIGELEVLIPAATRSYLMALAPRRELVIDLNRGPVSAWTPVRLPHPSNKETQR